MRQIAHEGIDTGRFRGLDHRPVAGKRPPEADIFHHRVSEHHGILRHDADAAPQLLCVAGEGAEEGVRQLVQALARLLRLGGGADQVELPGVTVVGGPGLVLPGEEDHPVPEGLWGELGVEEA